MSLISVDEARAILSANALAPVATQTRLEDALGRVLAADVRADRDLPPFDRSAVDGYAVAFRGIWKPGTEVREVGRIAAGEAWPEILRAGEALRIMTGAPVPRGARAVVMIERSRRVVSSNGAPRVVLDGPLEGEHPGFAPRGEDARRGTVVAPRNSRLEPSHVAVLASVGAVEISTYAPASVAIVSTGGEIVPATKTPRAEQIRNSNAPFLRALLRATGAASVHSMTVAVDQERALDRALARAEAARVIVLTGGVSKGDFDRVPHVLRSRGWRVRLHGVAMRPGKPLLFATSGSGPARRAVFALPGNPVSVLATAWEFLAPYLRDAAGLRGESGDAARMAPWSWTARMSDTISRKPGLTHFVPARCAPGADGRWQVSPLHWNGSGDFVAASRANCLIPLDAARPRARAGQLVPIHPLFREAWHAA